LEILQQVHSRRLDQKNKSIDNLKQYVREADTQFSTALQSHLMNIDTLIDLQNSRLESLRQQFESDLATIDQEFQLERMKLQSDHVKERADILGIMARAEHEFQEAEADAKHEYSSIRDDVKNKVPLIHIESGRKTCIAYPVRRNRGGLVETISRSFESIQYIH
jgi:ABC-type transporter Mla subunit MlaD